MSQHRHRQRKKRNKVQSIFHKSEDFFLIPCNNTFNTLTKLDKTNHFWYVSVVTLENGIHHRMSYTKQHHS